MRQIGRINSLLICLLAIPCLGNAQNAETFLGRTVASVIDQFRAEGWSLVYSSNLVGSTMLVTVEPQNSDRIDIVRQILKPHKLAVRAEDEFFLVVRMTKAEAQAQTPLIQVSASSEPMRPVLETITVSASRYHLSRELSNSLFYIDQRTIQNMPDLGEDPIRITQRLPGAASGGVSAKSHFRGGEESETGIILNGHRLFDPFHVRDYRNIFSSIDARAINGVEVFTGGFPVRYGDRMSGVVLIDTLNPDQPNRTELGLSVYNASLLTSGTVGDGEMQWLFSGRRGNLDLVINKEFGEPSYYDLFGQVSVNFSPNVQLSAIAMYAEDNVVVILESEPAELEKSASDTKNAQFWLRLDNRWASSLSSTSLLSLGSFSNDRIGSTSDEEKYVSFVDDKRTVDQFGFRQDWTWGASDNHRLQWGFNLEHSDTDYDYASEVTYFGLSEILTGESETLTRDLVASPDGDSYGVYLSDRWRVRPRTFLEVGLRWDKQTYTDLDDNTQVSPRIGLFHSVSPNTELRLSWGRFSQSQGIHELQIEDGVTTFSPAQRADHFIAGLYHRFATDYSFRIELFQKDMDRLRPRYENLFDPLALIPEVAPDRVEIAPSKARSKGVEISLDYSTTESLNWWATYTLSEVTDIVNGVEERRSWDQRHSFGAGVSWSGSKWESAIAVGVHTGWPKTNLELVESVDSDGELEYTTIVGPRNIDRYSTFASVDLRISRKFDVRRGNLTAFFEVTNATNRRNICCSDYDIDEQDDGSLDLEYGEDTWLPLVPAIGVLWQF